MKLKFSIHRNRAQIQCDSKDIFDVIRENFSVENPAKRFSFRKRFIPARLYAISPLGTFDVGMYKQIIQFAATKQLVSSVEFSDEFKKVATPTKDVSVFDSFTIPLRDYQLQSVQSAIKSGRGICLLATGAGKTLLTASIIASFQQTNFDYYNCLVLVPDPGLALQTVKEFETYNVPFSFSLWTGQNELNTNTQVVVANQDIVLSRMGENSWIESVDMLIVDEVHTIKKGNKISKVVEKIKTNNKFGLTGTLPDNIIDQWNIIGKIGPVITEVSSDELRKKDFLAQVSTKVLRISYNSRPSEPTEETTTAKYFAELDHIYNNKFRNSVIKHISQNIGNNTLILINHLRHGDRLVEEFKNTQNKQIFYVRGEMEIEDREKVKDMMEKNNDVICIAMSSIFSTGINIKNIHAIIFAAGGKSTVRVIQSIGRGLRLHELKKELTIIDIQDCITGDDANYGLKHGAHRISIYNQQKIPYSITNIVEK